MLLIEVAPRVLGAPKKGLGNCEAALAHAPAHQVVFTQPQSVHPLEKHLPQQVAVRFHVGLCNYLATSSDAPL